MSQETEQQLLALSARQMDRRLASRKRERRRRIYGSRASTAAVLGYIANVSTAYGYFFKWLDTGQMSHDPVNIFCRDKLEERISPKAVARTHPATKNPY